jgi:hypothetical protein
MRGRPRYYVKSEGPNVEAVLLGLSWLVDAATRLNATEAILALPTKQNLRGTVTEALGGAAAAALAAGRPVKLLSGASLRLVTVRMSWYLRTPAPVLCVYLAPSQLEKVDGTPNVAEMCLVPWIMAEVRDWIETWQAVDLTGEEAAPPAPRLDPVLKEALLSLTQSVNLGTGIGHPSDRSDAIQTFRILRRHRIPFDPEAVRRWLVAEGGWEPTHAQDVKKIAEGVLAGRRFRDVEGIRWADDIVKQWREDAEKHG